MSIGTPLLVDQTMGPKEYAKILSWILTIGLIANSLASAVNGIMADALGYNAVMLLAAVMLVVALVLTMVVIMLGKKKWSKAKA